MLLYCIHFRLAYIFQWLINGCIRFNHIYNMCFKIFVHLSFVENTEQKTYRVPSKQSVVSLTCQMSGAFISEVTLHNVKIYKTIWILKTDCIYEIKFSLNKIKQIMYFSVWQKYTVINSHINLLQGRCSCHVLELEGLHSYIRLHKSQNFAMLMNIQRSNMSKSN